MSLLRTLMLVALTGAFVATSRAGVQPQTPNARSGWPCGARLDPSYFQIAEGTGGHLLLLAPEEIADSAALLTALGGHPQTITRIAGAIERGLHEIPVPIDSSVESVVFSMSTQCLQSAEVVRPSGAPAIGDDVTELSNFRAERMVIVRRPQPGTWTMRIAGTGVGGIVVQARSAIGIAKVDFSAPDATSGAPVPKANVENVLRISVTGEVSDVRAYLVTGTLQRLASLALDTVDTDGTFVSRVSPGITPFRVLVTGRDGQQHEFQRVSAPLLTPTR